MKSCFKGEFDMDSKKLTLKKLFEHEVEVERIKLGNKSSGVFTVEEISLLPEPI
jgi:hypothetical protein